MTENKTLSEDDPLYEVFKKDKVNVVSITKEVLNDLSNEEKQKILRYNRNKEALNIDEEGDIICKSWGNYFIVGFDEPALSVELINEYLDECKKPIKNRRFENFTIGIKHVIENFEKYDNGYNLDEFTL